MMMMMMKSTMSINLCLLSALLLLLSVAAGNNVEAPNNNNNIEHLRHAEVPIDKNNHVNSVNNEEINRILEQRQHHHHRQQQRQRSLQTFSWPQFGTTLVGEAAGDRFGSAVSMNGAGTRVAIASPRNFGGNNQESGAVHVYEERTTTASTRSWVQLGQDLDGLAGSGFGQAVSLSGNGRRIAIGSINRPPYNGFVIVYEYDTNNDNTWVQVGSQLTGINEQDRFGWSVSMNYDGSRLAVGAPEHDSRRGQVRIFDYNAASTVRDWEQIGVPLLGLTENSWFGISVSLSSSGDNVDDGKVLAIGASSHNKGRGYVSVYYQRSSMNNQPWETLGGPILGTQDYEQSGFSVAISRDGMPTATGKELVVAIGSPYYTLPLSLSQPLVEDCGRVRVYYWADATTSNPSWQRKGGDLFVQGTPAAKQFFGNSVKISGAGDIVASGAPYDTYFGSVGVYSYSNGFWGSWNITSGSEQGELYGNQVALSYDGTRVLVAAPLAEVNGIGRGKSQVFQYTTSAWDLDVREIQSNIGADDVPEFTLILDGKAPSAVSGRKYFVEIPGVSCALSGGLFGLTGADAIKPTIPSGNVPSATEFTLSPQFEIDYTKIRTSSYYGDDGNGMATLSMCVDVRIEENNNVVTQKKINVVAKVDMNQDYDVSFQPGKAPDFITVNDDVQSNFTLDAFVCNENGVKISTATNPVNPGDMVYVCLESKSEEGAIVVNAKSVSFKNTQEPFINFEVIDENGNPQSEFDASKDCTTETGTCIISAETRPGLYEVIDSNGQPKDISAGVYMSGTAMYQFVGRRRRNLQEEESATRETIFNVNIKLATPPDRSDRLSSAAAASTRRTALAFITGSLLTAMTVSFW